MDHREIIDFVKKEFDITVVEKNDSYIMPTICHNLDSREASHKLYLYKNDDTGTPIFYCYTGCGEGFNIYQLIQKYKALRGEEISFRDAYQLFHGEAYKTKQKESGEELIAPIPVFEDPRKVELPEYSDRVLELFPNVSLADPWALEGIDLEILEKYEISFSASYEGVMIPHRDWQGRLVGLRIRTYNEEKMKKGKYMPLLINNVYYRHPLSLNLFGIYQNRENILNAKRAILVESEKSVLQAESMFKEDNITLAVCGSSISSWQLSMLVYDLGIEELIIGFDKEYQTFDEQYNYIKRIKAQLGKIENFVSIGILVDDNNTFSLKESPFDRTANDFRKLTVRRI